MVDESSPVSVISSSSAWSPDPPRIATGRVAGVIGPELEHAFDDGSALMEALPSATIIGEAEASSENLIDVLQGNSIVHVAAHSHFRPDSVMFSSLRLADGLMPVYEFTRLASCPQLVVLAACEAGGTGGSGFGEWLGLVPELLRAGAECLVAPIRPIADVDASLVMRHFYRHLPDASVAGALARTRLDLLDQAPRVQAAGHAFLAFGRGHAVLG
jgi:CHAT domain-containing protein